MPDFRCVPISSATAHRFRASGLDDRGNPFRRRGPGPDSRCPCRHCLRFARPDEPVLLGSYDLPRPQGVYWTPSPIFLHETACDRYEAVNHIPEIVRGSLVSVRAYDADDLCLYDLGHVAEGMDIDQALQRALADRRTEFVNIHTAKPGCLLCQVKRC